MVVGSGPAGLIAALQLSKNGAECMLVDRTVETTKWPKMDITNCRSMEIFKRLGIDQSLRKIGEAFDSQYCGPNELPTGVPENFSLNVLFSTGLSDSGELIAKWV